MVDKKIVLQQLARIGATTSFWGQPELNELPNILIDGEEIQHILNGYYHGGFATLCATNMRLLLIDKKVFFLNLEDIRYDMIAEVDYGHQFMGATIHIRSFSKDLKFQSFKQKELRDFTNFIQKRVMELRGHQVENRQAPIPTSNRSGAIPLQVFETGSTSLTDLQAETLVPMDPAIWQKVNEARRQVNPYAQTPLMIRRRIGRFSNANNK
ncbi:MAG: PH domain-containing protein [Candidatus Saccharibacteria bacterium]